MFGKGGLGRLDETGATDARTDAENARRDCTDV